MIENNLPLSVDPSLPATSFTIEPEGEDPSITELEDGSVEIDLSEDGMGDLADPVDAPHDANLVDYLEDSDLASIASDLVADFEADVRSRADWERTYIQGLDLMGLKIEQRNKPWKNACGVFHPVLAEAVIRFQSETIMEIMPATGPAKTKIIGKANEITIRTSARVENELNNIVIEKMPDYRAEKEQMLFHLAMAGSAFTKTYFDPLEKRPATIFVPAEDFVVAYGTTHLHTCPRKTHVMRYHSNEVKRLQASGWWRNDIELSDPVQDTTPIEERYDKASGHKPAVENDKRHKILEMHVDLDLPGFEDPDGIELPYVVTIDKSDTTILAIRRNWREDDPARRARKHFTHYKYLPGIGFYGTGLIHILGGIAKSATSILRQLIDAGTLANLPAGFKARSLRVLGKSDPFEPGEFRDVDAGSTSIKDSIAFLPYKEPSTVLYQLLTNLVEEGRRIGSITEMDISKVGGDAPVGTTLALIERSMKVMSAVQARVHSALGEELKMIAEIVRDFMPDEYEYDNSSDDGTTYSRGDDFNTTAVSVIPVSDPNASTMAQKLMQYQAALELAKANPELYNMAIIHRQMLEVLNIPNAEQIIKGTTPPPSMDPVSENMAILNGQPVQVYPEQDQDSHIKIHQAFITDPKYQQFISQSPTGPAIMAAMQQHIAEHLGYSYRREMEQSIGASLPTMGDKLSPDIENDIAKLASLAAAKVVANHQAQAAMEQAQAAAQDPLVMIEKMKLEIKNKEANIKELTAVAEAYFKANKIAIEQEAMQHTADVAALEAFTAMNTTAVKEEPLGSQSQAATPPAPAGGGGKIPAGGGGAGPGLPGV